MSWIANCLIYVDTSKNTLIVERDQFDETTFLPATMFIALRFNSYRKIEIERAATLYAKQPCRNNFYAKEIKHG